MKCTSCGSDVNEDSSFCDSCGAIIANEQSRSGFGIEHIAVRTVSKEKVPLNINKIIIALIVIIFGLICVLIGVIVANRGKRNSYDIPTYFPEPEQTTEILTDSFIRKDLYNKTLEYKRMSEIHNTELTTDDIYYVIKYVIEDFNRTCENYMNNGNEEIFKYLPKDTIAYEQQVSYKKRHPELQQQYISTDVINTRIGNNYYYAWVSETLKVNENNTERINTDHWVYKLSQNNGSWYICDYTRDPVYE